MIVPAHAGGVDLSIYQFGCQIRNLVPAHAGGVDLSTGIWASIPLP